MKPVFVTAGGILGLSGFLRLVELAMAGVLSNGLFAAVLAAMLGAAYLVTAIYLLRRSDASVTFGILVPAIGLLAAVLRVVPHTAPFNTILPALDVAAIAICVYLYLAGRAPIKRVR